MYVGAATVPEVFVVFVSVVIVVFVSVVIVVFVSVVIVEFVSFIVSVIIVVFVVVVLSIDVRVVVFVMRDATGVELVDVFTQSAKARSKHEQVLFTAVVLLQLHWSGLKAMLVKFFFVQMYVQLQDHYTFVPFVIFLH